MRSIILTFSLLLSYIYAVCQLLPQAVGDTQFLLGADISYTNEMEDCGVVFKKDGEEKDPYQLLAEEGCHVVRLRLWHTPSWYDELNEGKRYSDLQDVKRSMHRIKAAGMKTLLNFHLSDTWADPQRQHIPSAWLNHLEDLEVLEDSVYQHIHQTLTALMAEGLVPEMVQVGNETNIEIMQAHSEEQKQVIDWERNAILINAGIRAIRDFEKQTDSKIQVALHMASPAQLDELLHGFISHGVVDFDIIGLSYYWAWHMPTTIKETGQIIKRTKSLHPEKEIMIFETGYIWTQESNDQAPNIISETHPDYHPASPENQLKWLQDLSTEVARNGGSAVLYWEPTWVSSKCKTQWGQGSHQEHATFFDFDNNVLKNGGMDWFQERYSITRVPPMIMTAVRNTASHQEINLHLINQRLDGKELLYKVYSSSGDLVQSGNFESQTKGVVRSIIKLNELEEGEYTLVLIDKDNWSSSKTIRLK